MIKATGKLPRLLQSLNARPIIQLRPTAGTGNEKVLTRGALSVNNHVSMAEAFGVTNVCLQKNSRRRDTLFTRYGAAAAPSGKFEPAQSVIFGQLLLTVTGNGACIIANTLSTAPLLISNTRTCWTLLQSYASSGVPQLAERISADSALLRECTSQPHTENCPS